MANIAFYRTNEEWILYGSCWSKDRTYAFDFGRITSLSAGTVTLKVGCLIEIRNPGISIGCSNRISLSFRTRASDTTSPSVAAKT